MMLITRKTQNFPVVIGDPCSLFGPSYNMDCFVISLHAAKSEKNSNTLSVMNGLNTPTVEADVVPTGRFSSCM